MQHAIWHALWNDNEPVSRQPHFDSHEALCDTPAACTMRHVTCEHATHMHDKELERVNAFCTSREQGQKTKGHRLWPMPSGVSWGHCLRPAGYSGATGPRGHGATGPRGHGATGPQAMWLQAMWLQATGRWLWTIRRRRADMQVWIRLSSSKVATVAAIEGHRCNGPCV